MMHQPAAPITSASVPCSDAWSRLDDALARLTTLVATIEADCAASGAAVALPRHRAARYAAMAALGGRINAFLAVRQQFMDARWGSRWPALLPGRPPADCRLRRRR